MSTIPHAANKTKFERIDLRTTAKIKRTLAYAAELSGISMSTFLVEAAWEKATHLIQAQELVKLTDKERHRFLSLLESPPKPAAKLKLAMKRYLASDR